MEQLLCYYYYIYFLKHNRVSYTDTTALICGCAS